MGWIDSVTCRLYCRSSSCVRVESDTSCEYYDPDVFLVYVPDFDEEVLSDGF